MVILTVALVSMAKLMAITLRMQQLGRNQTLAMRLAQGLLFGLVFSAAREADSPAG